MIVSVAVGDDFGLIKVSRKYPVYIAVSLFPCPHEKRTKAFGEKKTKTGGFFSPFCTWCLHKRPALLEMMKSTLQYLRLGCQKYSKNRTNMQSKWFIPSSSYR